MDNELLQEYRCNCGKLLFKAVIECAKVEVKCKGCRRIVQFKKESESTRATAVVDL